MVEFLEMQTNVIESPYSGVRMITPRVSCWKNDCMVLRWVASAFLAVEEGLAASRDIEGSLDDETRT